LRQTFTRHPIERFVEGTRQPVEKLLDLRRFDHDRRRQRQYVARNRAHHQALPFSESDRGGADTVLRVERTFAGLVGDKLNAADQAEPARLADSG
jgi:hypothetical protein